MKRGALLGGVVVALALAGCGGGGGASPPGAGRPGATSTSTGPSATSSPTGVASSPTSAPVISALGGVPSAPLPKTAANGAANAGYACRWFGQLAELLSDASSYKTVSAQAGTDIREVAAFADSAGAAPSYAKLARDAAALNTPPFLNRLAHPADLLRSAQVGAVQADCDS